MKKKELCAVCRCIPDVTSRVEKKEEFNTNWRYDPSITNRVEKSDTH